MVPFKLLSLFGVSIMLPMTEKRFAYSFLLCVALFVALQTTVVALKGEPYPAVILPGFGSRFDATHQERPTVLLLRGDELLSSHTMRELAPSLPVQQAGNLVHTHMHHSASPKPSMSVWAAKRAAELNPSAKADRLVIRWHRHPYPGVKGQVEWAGDFSIPLDKQ